MSDPEDAAAFDYNWADVPASDEPPAEEFKSNAEFNNYFITAKARRTTAKHVSATLTSVASLAAAPILAPPIICFLIGQLLFHTTPHLIAMSNWVMAQNYAKWAKALPKSFSMIKLFYFEMYYTFPNW
jgi:hypothetical protein